MKNKINNLKFFVGGKAIFTVANGKGKHYTYKISKIKGTKETAPLFVSLLNGIDTFAYLGLYFPEQNIVKLTTKSKFNAESTPVKVLNWTFKKVADGSNLPTGYTIQHEGRCCRCGRTLTTPNSIENGIGPECSKFF